MVLDHPTLACFVNRRQRSTATEEALAKFALRETFVGVSIQSITQRG
jgi:hypothetical protein